MMLLYLLGCAAPVSEPLDDSWTLVWSDTFDGPAGTPPDPTIWVPDVGGDGWGNNQLEYDTDRIENAELDGAGRLAITARAEEYQGNSYTSARLTTKGTFQHGYGRYEADLQIPAGTGFWPAFWLLGANIDTVSWPNCGEVDILEAKGEDPDTMYATVHGPGYSGAGGISDHTSLRDGTFADSFHTVAVDIDPDHITFWMDDERVNVIRPGDLPDRSTWVFDNDWFLILNLAVGGNYVSPPNADTPFPASMLVDEVRVYDRAQDHP